MRVKTLIFAIALSFCGGSTLSSDTTEQNQDDTTTTTTTETVVDQDDTTTTTTTTTVVEKDDQVEIPDAPSVNFDIQEIYNTKLVVELCSDAKDIDNTSEECLKQYLANLEIVFSYAASLETYINDLNSYLEQYPEQMSQEYRDLFEFINNKWSSVPATYGVVATKYYQRFGSGNMPDSGNTSGGGYEAASDDPPLLKNLLIINWGPYDAATGISGDFEFRSDLQLVFFDEFGRVHSAGTPGAYDNPTFEYKVPRDTKVYIPIDGVIDFFQFQPTTSYKQDDWELMIKPRKSSDWEIVIDHVVSLDCDRSSRDICQKPLTVNGQEIYSGMEVKAGDLLGYVGNYEDGEGGSIFGRTEVTIGKYVQASNTQKDFNNFCPTNYLHPDVKDKILAEVNQIMASYESWSGNSNFYDEANMVAPGCWYSEIYEANGKTTPKK